MGLWWSFLCTVALTFMLTGWLGTARAADDPAQLQQQAIKRLDTFIDDFRKTGDSRARVGDLLIAQQELLVCYQGFMGRRDLANAALCLLRLGDAQRLQGRWQPALDIYREAEQVARQARHETHLTRALMRQASAETALSGHAAALTHIDQAIPLAEALPDKGFLFDSYDIKAQIQLAQGDLAGAADSLNRAFTIAKQVKDEAILFYGYFHRADVYFQLAERCDSQKNVATCMQQLALAKQDYTQARAIAQKLGWPGLVKQMDGFLERLEFRLSLLNPQVGVRKPVQQPDHFKPRKAGQVLVTEHFVSADPDLAVKIQPLHAELVRSAQLAGGFADATAALAAFLEGRMRQIRGDAEGALQHFYKAIHLVERDRRRLNDDRTRGSFVEDKISFYHATVLQLLEQRRYAEAFSVMERSKSRALADLLATKELRLSNPKDQALYAELMQQRTKIASLQSQLFALTTHTPNAQKEIAAKSATIQALEKEHARLMARMPQEAPRLQELVLAQPAALERLQQAMRAEQFEVLQYLVMDTGLILWYIGPDTVTVRNVFIPRRELATKVVALQNSLSDRYGVFDQETARELFLFLIQPVLGSIKGHRLVIIPHEELHRMPFQPLINPDDGRFLGERFQLSYAPSATVLLSLKRAGSIKGGRLFAVADPRLSAAREEVAAIAQLYPNGSKVVQDPLAREADVKTWIGNYDVIHLSVHGKYQSMDPLFSYLKLASGGQDDGNLTAAEIFGLPLSGARLVVLSACETAQAEITRGDELIGLVRALFYAGAGSLVLSQWQIESESTALWMQTFYREAQAKPLSEAARLAQLAVKNRKEYHHPYYWAAFMVVTR